MTLDSTSWNDLYEHIRARGFSGTVEEWFAEMRRQESASKIRDFARYAMAICLDKSLEPVFLAGCLCVRPKFEYVQSSSGGMTANISFGGRIADANKGVRISQLEVTVRCVRERAYVQVHGYVRGELRLDRIFVAPKGDQA